LWQKIDHYKELFDKIPIQPHLQVYTKQLTIALAYYDRDLMVKKESYKTPNKLQLQVLYQVINKRTSLLWWRINDDKKIYKIPTKPQLQD